MPLDAVELPEPRLKPPKPLAEIFSARSRTTAIAHALGKAYRDVVRGFRGEFEHPPDLVAYPESRGGRRRRALTSAPTQKAAAIPFGGGTSVVGGVEPRASSDYTGAVTIDLRRMDRVLEVDADLEAARIQAGATGPGLEEQLREHGLTLRHFPQSFEYSTLGGWIATRAGGHFATLYTHIDDLVESVRAVTPAGDWESRRLPGSGAGPSPDRMLLGSEGILGVIVDAWVRVRERPRGAGLLPASPSTTSRPGRRPCGRSRSRASTRPTAACSTPSSPRLTSAGPPGKALLRARLRVRAPSGRRTDGARARAAAATRRRARSAARSGGAAATAGAAIRSAPGATPSCTPPTCATRWSPAASSPTPSRRRSPGTASPTSTPR